VLQRHFARRLSRHGESSPRPAAPHACAQPPSAVLCGQLARGPTSPRRLFLRLYGLSFPNASYGRPFVVAVALAVHLSLGH
jgi:hypothetical protein